MQQDAGPAGTEHDGHAAGRRGARVEVDHGLVHGLARVLFQDLVAEVAVVETAAAAAGALLAAAVLFGDDLQRQAHQRAHVGGEMAVGTGDENDFVFGGEARHHLDDARVHGARLLLQPFQ